MKCDPVTYTESWASQKLSIVFQGKNVTYQTFLVNTMAKRPLRGMSPESIIESLFVEEEEVIEMDTFSDGM